MSKNTANRLLGRTSERKSAAEKCAGSKRIGVRPVGPPACHGCGQRHHTNAWTGYYWQAEPSRNSFFPHNWNVWAITECGHYANTEAVASFVGKYHNAQRNAEECAGFHNTALLKRIGGTPPARTIAEIPPTVEPNKKETL